MKRRHQKWRSLVLLGGVMGATLGVDHGLANSGHEMSGFGGAVSSEDEHASQAGMDMLNNGGNAVDAAIAVAAMQGVTRPYSGGIGGGGVMNLYLKETDEHIMINSLPVTPASFHDRTYFNEQTGSLYNQATRTSSGAAFSIPGTVKHWEHVIEEYGSLPMEDVLSPAIELARSGFVADANYVSETNRHADRFRLFTSSSDLFLDGGSVPAAGDTITNRDLARSYELIAEHGASVFYDGEIADAMRDTINEPPTVSNPSLNVLAGDVTSADFSNYEIIKEEPIHSTYREYDVYGAPPASSGGVTIASMLNMLENENLSNMSKEDAYHYYLESSRYAFADRRAYLGDPEVSDVPVNELLSDRYTQFRHSQLGERAAIGQVPPGNPRGVLESSPNLAYDFDEENGQEWSKEAFYRLDYGPANSPFDADFNVRNGQGEISLSERLPTRGSAYGRAAANVEPSYEQEVRLTVNADHTDSDQRLRLFLAGDVWQSGGSQPENGYGLELRLDRDEIRLFSIVDGTSHTLQTTSYALEDREHELAFVHTNNHLYAKAWASEEEEPRDWTLSSMLSGPMTINQPGRFMLSAINFSYDNTQQFSLDRVNVRSLDNDRVHTLRSEEEAEPAERQELPDEDADGFEIEEERSDESTIHLATSDAEGNVVSYTNTIVSIGGNGMVVPGYGFLLNNDAYNRIPTEHPTHPNYPQPGMRTLSSMSPTIVMKDGNPVVTVGAPGSDTIITTVAQILMNYLDRDLSLTEAIEEPRITQRNNFNAHTEFEGRYESETSDLRRALEERGHIVREGLHEIGAATGIAFHEDGRVSAAAEAERRGGGSALVQQQLFSDVPPDTFAYDAIMNLTAQGILTGYSDGTYRRSQAVNRGQSARIIARALELPSQKR
ncbi:gamma-glutamyltransferase [Geomicrobium sp. JCM 19037]|uniref:gamma-glutamyltransferase n=1 Tax=Geomicrobium sp. JCM 19037 TaxID=1460634 RepID=UPI000694B1DC|nr:gamma-glutamyltransferase [Geomicrobium sp. JCM 19037]